MEQNVERGDTLFTGGGHLLSGNGRGGPAPGPALRTAHLFEGKLYIQTGKVKAVSRQILANPKVEICASLGG